MSEIKENVEQKSETGKEQPVVENGNADYLAAIKKLKENTVSRSEYDKVREDNKRLLAAVVDGEPVEVDKSAEKPISTKDMAKELLNNPNLSNLEYVTKSLELRKRLMSEGKPDPFAPFGTKHITTQAELDTAERVASILEKCVEVADGNKEVFNMELKRHIR